MLLKQASGVQVGGIVDVVLVELVVNVIGVVEEPVVTGVDDMLELVVTGGDTQIVPPQVIATTGEVTHTLPVVPLTTEVVQLVMLLVIAEQVVIGGAQLVVGGGPIQMEFAQVVVVIGVVTHMVEDPLVLQLVLAVVVVEQVVIGDVQLEEDDIVLLEVVGVVLELELVLVEVVLEDELEVVLAVVDEEVMTGGLTQMVLAHVVVVSGEVTHCDEAPLLTALQMTELPVVVTEHVVIGEVQLESEVVVLGGLTQIVLAQALVVTGIVAQDVKLSLMVLQLTVLVVPDEQVVIGDVQLVNGVVALTVTCDEVVVLVEGAEVRETVVLDVITVDPPLQASQGTVTVVI